MNAEAERLVEARREEVERLGGLGAYRLRALQNLKLKTVIKVRGHALGSEECRHRRNSLVTALRCSTHPPPPPLAACRCRLQESHASPVQALAVNHTDPSLCNLFATVGKDQATGVHAPARSPGRRQQPACRGLSGAAGGRAQPAAARCLANSSCPPPPNSVR